ncbi:jg21838 [Pararge aegeria aegeria]|uniref:Jg21838 protein n=1 Tax=Pararge aegeria aegeria TaxID=348720 RepID=A0A8S4QLA5_9NEOP|nr:jg21838 [Pararge aegeria aegeria]
MPSKLQRVHFTRGLPEPSNYLYLALTLAILLPRRWKKKDKGSDADGRLASEIYEGAAPPGAASTHAARKPYRYEILREVESVWNRFENQINFV